MRMFPQPSLRNMIMVIFTFLMLMKKQRKDSSSQVRIKEDDGGENCSNMTPNDWPGTALGLSEISN